MAAIFKQKYTGKSRDGTRFTRETSKYYIEYRDGFGVIRRVPGLRDKRATEAMAAELERAAARAAVFGRPVVEANRPILAHVNDYDHHLTALGVSDRWRRETLARIRWIIDHTRSRRLADLDAVSIARPLTAVLDAGRSARTRDAYLLSIRAFLRWAILDHRLDADLESISRMPLLNDRRRARRVRRVLAPAEMVRLLAAARARPVAGAGRVTRPERLLQLERIGLERALIYVTLYATGLRRGELARVELRDVELPPTGAGRVSVRGKNGRVEVLPIIPWLASELRAWVATMPAAPPTAHLFRVPVQLIKSLRRDLAFAGIDYRDDRGRTADVHSLRHATATFMAAAGVPPRTAQQVMRHSTIELTMNTYVDVKTLDMVRALESLPLPAPIIGGSP
ncbi:MAG: site-specific integrase [Planctomycetes bacterium]|nr:site-specific integrase [Planctomycetota bacterium]